MGIALNLTVSNSHIPQKGNKKLDKSEATNCDEIPLELIKMVQFSISQRFTLTHPENWCK